MGPCWGVSWVTVLCSQIFILVNNYNPWTEITVGTLWCTMSCWLGMDVLLAPTPDQLKEGSRTLLYWGYCELKLGDDISMATLNNSWTF